MYLLIVVSRIHGYELEVRSEETKFRPSKIEDIDSPKYFIIVLLWQIFDVYIRIFDKLTNYRRIILWVFDK